MRTIEQYDEFMAALERAIELTHDRSLELRTDPCASPCLRCCAMTRAMVLHYWGTVEKPALGSSFSSYGRREQALAEIELEKLRGCSAAPETCEYCEKAWATSKCGCQQGACRT